MRDFFRDLAEALEQVCPTFLELPADLPYPHITLEDINSLSGLPAGPTLVSFSLKIWSLYRGPKEILKLLHEVELLLKDYKKNSMKIVKSSLTLLKDRETRVHTLHIKARLPL